MKLQRFSLVDTEDWIFDGENEYPVTTQAIGLVDDGEYYRFAADGRLLPLWESPCSATAR